MTTLYDPYRKREVAKTPEEVVRQNLLHQMTQILGFPKSSLVIEKQLKELPHLQGKSVPERRLDILCYEKGTYPLLLIECKAVPLTREVLDQVIGYNTYIEAPFIAVANQSALRLGWREGEEMQWIDHLPKYSELVDSVKRHDSL